MGTPVSENYDLQGQNPLDKKLVSLNKASLIAGLAADQFLYFRFYKGQIIFFQEESEEYIWLEMTNILSAVPKLLTSNYTYPVDTVSYGFDYSGKSFNFIKYSDYLKIVIEINEGLLNNLENEGVGVEFFNGKSTTTGNAKIAKLNSATQKILKQDDGSVNSEIDFFNRGSEDAISLYEFFPGSKTHGFSKILSNNLITFKDGNGNLNINSPGGGSNSFDYYLDVNFIRPSNWIEKAELIDGIETAKGTLNDPFKTFEEYLRRCIGETGGSNDLGVYSRINPKNPYKKLRILSDLTTDKILEINNCSIWLQNNVILFYNGTEDYAVDTERLWDLMPKTVGVLNRSISYEIGGEGTLININNFGVINHKTSVISTTDTIDSTLFISPVLSGLKIEESMSSATYTLLTNGDGSPYLEAGIQVKGSTQVPIIPLIKIDGNNQIGFSVNISGTTLEITSSTQSFIQTINDGSVNINCDQVKYLLDIFNIGYEKKLYTGLSGMTSDETELLIGRNDLFFKPYSSRKVFDISGYLRVERISTISQYRLTSSVDSIFHVNTNSTIDILDKYTDTGGGSAISLISSSGINTNINLKNTLQTSYMNFFVKGDNINTINVKLESGNLNKIDKVKKNVPILNILTEGAWSSIKSIPINTGLASFANNAEAVSANYIIGMSYFNTTENAISQVI
jgi:hypothetical protein